MNRVRSFIAVDLPVEVVEQARQVQAELRTRAQEAGMKVGWVAPQNLHVTLKFLAEIPEESVWAIRDLLRDRLAQRPAISLDVGGVGAFPAADRPRVLWVGLGDPSGELVRLAQDLDQWLDELGFEKEKRPFRPHLTLGRVKANASNILQGLEDRALGQCTASEVVLYKSVLDRRGAQYTPLAQVALAKQQ